MSSIHIAMPIVAVVGIVLTAVAVPIIQARLWAIGFLGTMFCTAAIVFGVLLSALVAGTSLEMPYTYQVPALSTWAHLVDKSDSMDTRLPYRLEYGDYTDTPKYFDLARHGASRLVEKRPLDQHMLTLFADAPDVLVEAVDINSKDLRVREGAQRIATLLELAKVRGGTNTPAGLESVLKQLTRDDLGEKRLVVYSDGEDNIKAEEAEQLKVLLEKSGARVYWIWMRGEGMPSLLASENPLHQFVRVTGGKELQVHSLAEVDTALNTILASEPEKTRTAIGWDSRSLAPEIALAMLFSLLILGYLWWKMKDYELLDFP